LMINSELWVSINIMLNTRFCEILWFNLETYFMNSPM
jgi:hypothetical protein